MAQIGTQTGHRAGLIAIRGMDLPPTMTTGDGFHLYRCSLKTLPSTYKAIRKRHGIDVRYGGVIGIDGLTGELIDLPEITLMTLAAMMTPAQNRKLREAS